MDNTDRTETGYSTSLLRRAALLAVLFAGGVVFLGAYTRLVDAGLGCPDWPGCYGHVLWPTEAGEIAAAEAAFPDAPVDLSKTWPEMVHRYFAGTLGLIILGFAAWAVRGRGRPDAPPLGLSLLLLAMVILQGAFGAWTVTLKLWPQVVTAHLLGGFTTLSLLWLLCLRTGALGEPQRFGVPAQLLPHAVLALVAVVLQIALGGWVSSNYAALACPDLPTCHGAWVPPMDLEAGFDVTQSVGPNYLGGLLENEARVAIQYVHRVGALVVAALVGALVWRLFQAGSRLAAPVGLVLAAQLTLGVLNVVLKLPLWSATLHNAVGALTLLALVTVNYAAVYRRRGPEPATLRSLPGRPVAA
ncbi:MAG: COX15/CtaA family protein [Pseudomonadota bacterium]